MTLLMALRQRACKQLISLRDFKFRSFGSVSAIERDPRFSQVNESDIQYFKSILGNSGVVTDPHDLALYNR